ncbi:transposase [Microbacterium testaceum]|nr:transposase [Microbacterium sp. SORGH_AS_0969]MDQ1115943.1 transposase [Microbacterium testaceum]
MVRDRIAGLTGGVRAGADGVDVASPDGRRRQLGQGAGEALSRARCGGIDQLVTVGGLDRRPRASARDEHHSRHRGAEANYTNPLIEPPDSGIGRSRGGLVANIYQLIDGNGLLLVTLITPGRAGDSPMFLPIRAHLRVSRAVGRPRTRPDAVRADKAYSSRAIRGHPRSRGIRAVISELDDQIGHRKRRGSRGRGPVGLEAADYKNRNVTERRSCHPKQWRGLATRSDKHASPTAPPWSSTPLSHGKAMSDRC